MKRPTISAVPAFSFSRRTSNFNGTRAYDVYADGLLVGHVELHRSESWTTTHTGVRVHFRGYSSTWRAVLPGEQVLRVEVGARAFRHLAAEELARAYRNRLLAGEEGD